MRGGWLHLRFVLFEPSRNIQHFGDVVAGAAADAHSRDHGKESPRGANKQREWRYVKVMEAEKRMLVEGFVDTFACASLD